MYNYRETITQSRKQIKGILPIDYSIKSYNDLVQSIVFSIIQEVPYNWIICEGLSEKIYFEEIFKNEILNNNLRILPLGSYKEVKKVYSYLLSPIKDPDYVVKGKVICLIDTDNESIDIECQKIKNLYFLRLLNTEKDGSTLVEVDSNFKSPPTEIEDCLHPVIYFQALLEFSEDYPNLKSILLKNETDAKARNSYEFIDLRDSERKTIKAFFDDNEGFNKIKFAKKYVELLKVDFFKNIDCLNWTENIKKKITQS